MPRERFRLINILEEGETSPYFDEPRLERIFLLIKDIQNQMMYQEYVPNSLRLNGLNFQASALVKVESWDFAPSSIIVKVRKYTLPMSTNIRLVDHYEQYPSKIFTPLDDIFKGGFQSPSLAVHTWKKQEGKWVKESVEKVFLE